MIVAVPVPLVTDQAPTPVASVYVEVEPEHTVAEPPLIAATVGKGLLVSTTSSVDVQAPLVMVHLRVALVPTGTPVTPEFRNVGLVMVAVPVSRLHAPVPVEGLLPARVKLPLLQLF